MKLHHTVRWMAVAWPLAASCSSSSSSGEDDAKAQLVQGLHDSVLLEIDALVAGATDLAAAAPVTAGRGWDTAIDAPAIEASRAAWIRTRTTYEHIEGVLAPLFPDKDKSIDARYDDFLSEIGPQGDAYLFDDQGVTGLHAVERVLFLDRTPAGVVSFEKILPGYVAAALPATAAESSDYKNKLCAKVVSDAKSLRDGWPKNLDVGAAFQGLTSLMNEQREKVNKASTNEEESRYSQRTMADLRGNLEGVRTAYRLFQPWLTSHTNASDPSSDGPHIDALILAGTSALDGLYATVPGDAIPQPPPTWSAENPSADDLKTPFGVLYSGVRRAVDPAVPGSVAEQMNRAAVVLGFPQFVEKP